MKVEAGAPSRGLRGAPRRFWLSFWLPLVKRASRAYVAGPALADALRVCGQLARLDRATTLGYWNREGEPPEEVAESYGAALEAIARSGLDSYLSVKAPALGFSPDLVDGLADRSRRSGIGIHFDALGPEAADATFSLIEAAASRGALVGCTLPGRWRRSVEDADRAIEGQLTVRVVKGQWAEPGAPGGDPSLRTGFLQVVDRLAGRARRVAVATHDPPLAREALFRLLRAGTPCGLELLLGLPAGGAARVARDLGTAVRHYVGYGDAWLPYCLRQLGRNPRVFWWLARDLVLGGAFRGPR